MKEATAIINGPAIRRTQVSLQSAYIPMDKPEINVARYCVTIANLFPIPS